MSRSIAEMATTRTSEGLVSYLSLFSSFGTLLCCALPSLLVLFGLGATVASFLSALPWLVTLSRHKNWVFLIAGLLIGGNFLYVYALAPRLQARAPGCPVNTPSACTTASRTSRVVLWVSASIYFVGVFSAYVLGPLLVRFGE
jgi:mercuric ion transport protein